MSVIVSLRPHGDRATSRVAKISGENVGSCMQCGTCSAVCPMVDSMEMSSRQVMLLLQHGLAERVVESKTAWVCASCHTCQVRCPRGIEIPRVMEALRQLVLRQNEDLLDPRGIPERVLGEVPAIAMVAAFRKFTA